MKRRLRWSRLLMVSAAMISAGVFWTMAQDDQKGAAPDMAALMKLATPGEHHKELAAQVGTWHATGTFWMEPGQSPIKTTGTMKNSLVLDGRFLKSEFKGDFLGQPFAGLGFEGFDNYSRKHVGTWMDTMGTLVLSFSGTCNADHTVRTMYSEYNDPASGQHQRMKAVTTMESPDRHTYMAWLERPDGRSQKSMEIVYTRQ